MSDFDHSPPDRGSEPIQFGEWLEMTAESRGESKEEVLEQLISSYWKLNEMTDMIQEQEGERDSEADNPFEHTVGATATPLSRSELQSVVGEFEAELADFEQRLTALEGELAEAASESTEKIEQRLETEFDTLRKILKRLIEQTNENEEGLEELHRQFKHDVAGLREERSELDHLRRRAMELGVTDARCDNCDADIDLSLLPSPSCPTCGRRFTDISPKRRVLGFGVGSNRLETEPYSKARSGTSSSPEERSAERDRAPVDSADDREPRLGGFEWQERRRG